MAQDQADTARGAVTPARSPGDPIHCCVSLLELSRLWSGLRRGRGPTARPRSPQPRTWVGGTGRAPGGPRPRRRPPARGRTKRTKRPGAGTYLDAETPAVARPARRERRLRAAEALSRGAWRRGRERRDCGAAQRGQWPPPAAGRQLPREARDHLEPAAPRGSGRGRVTPSPPGAMATVAPLRYVQSILSRLSAKLTWTYKDGSGSPDTPGSSFQMMFEVDGKPGTLSTDSLAVKNFLRRIIMVHPKITVHLSVKVNGALAEETIRAENEPIFNLPNGIALIINEPRYVSRIHPVPGQPVTLSIPDDVAGTGLVGELILMPVAALCSCLEASSKQMGGISSVSMFLYGPSGLPLVLPGQEQPTTVFTDPSCFIDWKKYHWCVTSHLDFNLDGDLVLPDMRCQVNSCEGHLSQDVAPQGQTLLLFIFVDFHSGFPAQQMELWGTHTLLASHLNAILLENQRGIRSSVQMAVDQALEQQQQAAKARRKLQASHAVAVDSILSVVSGSTSSSFRRGCLQALQAADTHEFGAKLHNAFKEITQHRFPCHCSCEIRQQEGYSVNHT
ncbi:type 2 DNA topoisomerase 6 subunit B-like [Tenrec ecaudatus]|uniref:type 2 DNA topoisomerase 6 subunit B-like n=1 Tax=Tenrec ecaudatus TaxID=94439 RepID=UPI003F5A6BDE